MIAYELFYMNIETIGILTAIGRHNFQHNNRLPRLIGTGTITEKSKLIIHHAYNVMSYMTSLNTMNDMFTHSLNISCLPSVMKSCNVVSADSLT